jgi:hypothetical protein
MGMPWLVTLQQLTATQVRKRRHSYDGGELLQITPALLRLESPTHPTLDQVRLAWSNGGLDGAEAWQERTEGAVSALGIDAAPSAGGEPPPRSKRVRSVGCDAEGNSLWTQVGPKNRRRSCPAILLGGHVQQRAEQISEGVLHRRCKNDRMDDQAEMAADVSEPCPLTGDVAAGAHSHSSPAECGAAMATLRWVGGNALASSYSVAILPQHMGFDYLNGISSSPHPSTRAIDRHGNFVQRQLAAGSCRAVLK